MTTLDLLVSLACAAVLSFLITYFLVPVLIDLAFQLNFVDLPDGNIKTHARITPYFGGVAVYVGFVAALSLVAPLERSLVFLVVGASVLLLIGLLDDLIMMKAYQKFAAQLVAAYFFLRCGCYLQDGFLPDYVALPISFLWILSIANAFNLVDVMDGLATTIALCATATFFVIALAQGNHLMSIALISFFGSLSAFLYYNKPVARMYLGDAGSLFLGGFLGAVPFLLSWNTLSLYGYFSPAIILAIPILEVASLIIIRTYKGIPFYLGSKDHFCHYLLAQQWSVQNILRFVAGVGIMLGACAILVVCNILPFWALCVCTGLFFAFWVKTIFGKWLFNRP